MAGSRPGTSHSVSPPFIEQKRLKEEVAPQSARARQRRSTLSAAPDLHPIISEEQVATHWNPHGIQPAFEHPSFDHNISQRNSYVPAFSNSPRAVSPEHKRAYSPVSIIRNGTWSPSSHRSGARSPVSIIRHDDTPRAVSPLRSEFATGHENINGNAAASPKPSRSQLALGVGNIAPNGNAFASQEEPRKTSHSHQATLDALQGGSNHDDGAQPPPGFGPQLDWAQANDHGGKTNGNGTRSRPGSIKKDIKRLSLQTQLPPPPPVPEEEEEVAEIISMSPAARKPTASFRKSRSSVAMSMYSSGPGDNSQVNLSGTSLTADPNKPYFGQSVSMQDLVADGIENAFSRL